MKNPEDKPAEINQPAEIVEEQSETTLETVTAPAKVMRIGSMIKQLLDEVHSMTLDMPSRERLAEIYERSIVELAEALSPDLQEELRMLALPFNDGEVPSDAELRVAKAQLVGWLEGLFHGIQATMFAQQLSMRQQAEQRQIQSGQAFFVKSAAGGTFTIKEAHKGTTFSNAVFRTAAPELLRVGLYKQVNNEWSGRDGAMTVILADADANQASNKMANGTENIAFTKNGASFASNHQLPLVASDVLNVKVWNTTAGANYKLKINTEEFMATNLEATLEDLFTNARTPLTLDGSSVEYPFTVTTEALSTGDRFRIVFQPSLLGNNIPKSNGFSIVPNPVTGDSFQVNLGSLSTGTYSYSICNAIGQEVEKGSINTTTQNTNYTVKFRETAATGIYIMKIKGSDNSVFTAKIIKK